MSKSEPLVLVAYDFSEGAHGALIRGIQLAKERGAKLAVVHVMSFNLPNPYASRLEGEIDFELRQDLEKTIQEKVESDVRNHVAAEAEGADIGVDAILIKHGPAHQVIVETAEDIKADLIVVGAHNRSALGYVFLGSVASKVIRYASVPVWVDRSDQRQDIQKVLVPVDESKDSEYAIELAKSFTCLEKAPLQLTHAVDINEFYYMEYANIRGAAVKSAQQRLKELNEKYELTEKPLVLDGSPSHAVVEVVKNDSQIGLVALTTHGYSGLKRFFLGSIAESIVKYAPCSVLVGRNPEHKEQLQEATKKVFADGEKGLHPESYIF